MKAQFLLQVITVVSCLVIVARAEPALNRMSRVTPILIRVSMHLLAIGALAEIGCIVVHGEAPAWPTAISMSGIAALLLCERRMRVFFPKARRKEVQR